MVVVPDRRASATRRPVLLRSTSSEAARVALTVVRMPPAEYFCPDIRAANSAVRSPAKTRCEWLSTKPGMTARPSASPRVSVPPPGRRAPGHDPAFEYHGGVADQPELALPEARIVRDQRADVIQEQGGHPSATLIAV